MVSSFFVLCRVRVEVLRKAISVFLLKMPDVEGSNVDGCIGIFQVFRNQMLELNEISSRIFQQL